MRFRDFLATLTVALTWLAGVTLYSLVKSGPDIGDVRSLMATAQPAAFESKGPALPSRWAHQLW